jgi:tagatose-1,6-bisphosphate aldolase
MSKEAEERQKFPLYNRVFLRTILDSLLNGLIASTKRIGRSQEYFIKLQYTEKQRRKPIERSVMREQLATVQEFQRYCDVLKIEFPGDALACATVTAEVDVPWIVLSRGAEFDEFVESVKVSLENGAKGFAVGRAIWQEIGEMRDSNGNADFVKIEQFLQTVGRERLQKLLALVHNAAQNSGNEISTFPAASASAN